jgi:hypothetical protein
MLPPASRPRPATPVKGQQRSIGETTKEPEGEADAWLADIVATVPVRPEWEDETNPTIVCTGGVPGARLSPGQ